MVPSLKQADIPFALTVNKVWGEQMFRAYYGSRTQKLSAVVKMTLVFYKPVGPSFAYSVTMSYEV